VFDKSSAMRVWLDTHQRSTALKGDAAQDRGFAPRPGAHVKPIKVAALGTRECKCNELTSFVLYSCTTITNAVQCIGHSIDERRGQGRQPARLGTWFGQEVIDAHASGTCHKTGSGRDVVGLQELDEFATALTQRITKCAHNPHRMRPPRRKPGRVILRAIGAHLKSPLLRIVRGNFAQDRIDESGPGLSTAGSARRMGEGTRRVNRSVIRYAHGKDLMGAKSQDVADRGLD